MKAVLIGAGTIARQHLACLKTLPGVELAGICDRSAVTAEAAAERYGASAWFTDHRLMLEKVRPDVVHVTTPPTSHFRLAMDAFDAGSHVFVEKPATVTFDEVEQLAARAKSSGRHLIEDYNYIFNTAPQRILELIRSGEFGAVTHVEAMICLDIRGPGGFLDPNAPHPALQLAGGPIGDFLPHVASLAHAFVGPLRSAYPVWRRHRNHDLAYDEFRAMLDAERGTAALAVSFSSQPDAFWLRVYGERMQATSNLFETRLTIDKQYNVPKPLRPFVSGLHEGKAIRRAALSTLLRKFKGPGAYEGLWELMRRTYGSLSDGSKLPISSQEVLEVNRIIEALKPVESKR